MIFVTVGTTIPFDGLIEEVDRLCGKNLITEPVHAQIGCGTHIPQHITWFRHLPNIQELEESADLVICHGGVGSVFELLDLRKSFVAVPNPLAVDGHQADLLHALESEGWCRCCWDLSQLQECLVNAASWKPPIRSAELPKQIWQDLFPGDS